LIFSHVLTLPEAGTFQEIADEAAICWKTPPTRPPEGRFEREREVEQRWQGGYRIGAVKKRFKAQAQM
jgi:hypothetical protein